MKMDLTDIKDKEVEFLRKELLKDGAINPDALIDIISNSSLIVQNISNEIKEMSNEIKELRNEIKELRKANGINTVNKRVFEKVEFTDSAKKLIKPIIDNYRGDGLVKRSILDNEIQEKIKQNMKLEYTKAQIKDNLTAEPGITARMLKNVYYYVFE